MLKFLTRFFFFFFQAEDGIRDAQESRGLGDVYKRQTKFSSPLPPPPALSGYPAPNTFTSPQTTSTSGGGVGAASSRGGGVSRSSHHSSTATTSVDTSSSPHQKTNLPPSNGVGGGGVEGPGFAHDDYQLHVLHKRRDVFGVLQPQSNTCIVNEYDDVDYKSATTTASGVGLPAPSAASGVSGVTSKGNVVGSVPKKEGHLYYYHPTHHLDEGGLCSSASSSMHTPPSIDTATTSNNNTDDDSDSTITSTTTTTHATTSTGAKGGAGGSGGGAATSPVPQRAPFGFQFLRSALKKKRSGMEGGGTRFRRRIVQLLATQTATRHVPTAAGQSSSSTNNNMQPTPSAVSALTLAVFGADGTVSQEAERLQMMSGSAPHQQPSTKSNRKGADGNGVIYPFQRYQQSVPRRPAIWHITSSLVPHYVSDRRITDNEIGIAPPPPTTTNTNGANTATTTSTPTTTPTNAAKKTNVSAVDDKQDAPFTTPTPFSTIGGTTTPTPTPVSYTHLTLPTKRIV
eukprot:TRINITY_DN15296_c0_g1_i4.p1 TRINITY_DN15296_c0_g1~~TRINITY_DN15296_c0_g1_i4.p1  ORF type:complete len:513 (-),score=115.52 TRINITY_DN15296_c0_g1_i4:143-1681(-)